MKGKFEKKDRLQARESALTFHAAWLQWDKDRALSFCLRDFKTASKPRQAAKATLLGAILFQRCYASSAKDVERAKKILPVLTLPEYDFVLRSYVAAHCLTEVKDAKAKNYINLLKKCGVSYKDYK